jgi:hypothetical protein
VKNYLTISNKKSLEKSLNALCSHRFFANANRNTVEREWCSQIPFKETATSSLLGWLLDPKQGHGLGDFFLKRLLQAATQKTRNDNIASNFDSWEPYQLSSWSLSQAIVQTEFSITTSSAKPDTKSEKRIDIFITDPLSEQTFVIERKAGAPQTGNQLKAYYDWVEKNVRTQLNHKVIYILSGFWNDELSAEEAENWLMLSDDWICNALDEVIDRKMVPENLRIGMQQLRHYVFGYWHEGADPFYRMLEQETSALRHELETELKVIDQAKFSNNQKILAQTRSSLIRHFLAVPDSASFWILNFLVSNYHVIHNILMYDQLHWATNQVDALTSNYQRSNKGGESALYFTLPDIPREGGLDTGPWCTYLILKKPHLPFEEEGSQTQDRLTYNIYLHIRLIETPDKWVNDASTKLAKSVRNDFQVSGKRKNYEIPTDFKGHLDKENDDWLKAAYDWFSSEWKKAASSTLG